MFGYRGKVASPKLFLVPKGDWRVELCRPTKIHFSKLGVKCNGDDYGGTLRSGRENWVGGRGTG